MTSASLAEALKERKQASMGGHLSQEKNSAKNHMSPEAFRLRDKTEEQQMKKRQEMEEWQNRLKEEQEQFEMVRMGWEKEMAQGVQKAREEELRIRRQKIWELQVKEMQAQNEVAAQKIMEAAVKSVPKCHCGRVAEKRGEEGGSSEGPALLEVLQRQCEFFQWEKLTEDEEMSRYSEDSFTKISSQAASMRKRSKSPRRSKEDMPGHHLETISVRSDGTL